MCKSINEGGRRCQEWRGFLKDLKNESPWNATLSITDANRAVIDAHPDELEALNLVRLNNNELLKNDNIPMKLQLSDDETLRISKLHGQPVTAALVTDVYEEYIAKPELTAEELRELFVESDIEREAHQTKVKEERGSAAKYGGSFPKRRLSDTSAIRQLGVNLPFLQTEQMHSSALSLGISTGTLISLLLRGEGPEKHPLNLNDRAAKVRAAMLSSKNNDVIALARSTASTTTQIARLGEVLNRNAATIAGKQEQLAEISAHIGRMKATESKEDYKNAVRESDTKRKAVQADIARLREEQKNIRERRSMLQDIQREYRQKLSSKANHIYRAMVRQKKKLRNSQTVKTIFAI